MSSLIHYIAQRITVTCNQQPQWGQNLYEKLIWAFKISGYLLKLYALWDFNPNIKVTKAEIILKHESCKPIYLIKSS